MDEEEEMIGNHYLIARRTEEGVIQLKQLLKLYGFFVV